MSSQLGIHRKLTLSQLGTVHKNRTRTSPDQNRARTPQDKQENAQTTISQDCPLPFPSLFKLGVIFHFLLEFFAQADLPFCKTRSEDPSNTL